MNSKLKHIQNWPELARQAKWSSSRLSNQCGTSTRTLERFFIRQMGKPLKSWLMDQRLNESMAFLKDGRSVKEATYLIDYKHVSTFSREFKKHFGKSPAHMLSLQANL